MLMIRVPATSANLGAGFDAMGLALNCYLTVTVHNATPTWEVAHDLTGVPHDAEHLLVQTALTVSPELQPHSLAVTSDIPTARGLGSSSAVIVAGIELANQLAQLNLTAEEKLAWATQIEGHPDNVAPAVLGGLVTCGIVEGELHTRHLPLPSWHAVAVIPDRELSTQVSRAVLPETMSYADAIAASQVANLLHVAMATQDDDLLRAVIGADRFHEPFRSPLVPELTEIRQSRAVTALAIGSYLSGAGPTVLTLVSPEHREQVATLLQQQFPHCTVRCLQPDSNGAVVIKQ